MNPATLPLADQLCCVLPSFFTIPCEGRASLAELASPNLCSLPLLSEKKDVGVFSDNSGALALRADIWDGHDRLHPTKRVPEEPPRAFLTLSGVLGAGNGFISRYLKYSRFCWECYCIHRKHVAALCVGGGGYKLSFPSREANFGP